MYQSWPGNTISLYAWYQTREVKWCEGWWGVSTNLFGASLCYQFEQCRYGTLVVLTGEAEPAGMHCHGRGPWAVAVGELL